MSYQCGELFWIFTSLLGNCSLSFIYDWLCMAILLKWNSIWCSWSWLIDFSSEKWPKWRLPWWRVCKKQVWSFIIRLIYRPHFQKWKMYLSVLIYFCCSLNMNGYMVVTILVYRTKSRNHESNSLTRFISVIFCSFSFCNFLQIWMLSGCRPLHIHY